MKNIFCSDTPLNPTYATFFVRIHALIHMHECVHAHVHVHVDVSAYVGVMGVSERSIFFMGALRGGGRFQILVSVRSRFLSSSPPIGLQNVSKSDKM